MQAATAAAEPAGAAPFIPLDELAPLSESKACRTAAVMVSTLAMAPLPATAKKHAHTHSQSSIRKHAMALTVVAASKKLRHGIDHSHAELPQRIEMLRREGMIPHHSVHGRRDKKGPSKVPCARHTGLKSTQL